jgi:hypothetical protein
MNNELEVLGRCGPALFFKAATVMIMKYPANDSVALVSGWGTEDQQIYSVCLAHDPEAPIWEGHVWLKGWSENEGAPAALEDAGLVRRTGVTWPTGFVLAEDAEILNRTGD